MGKKIFKLHEKRLIFFMKPSPEANKLKKLVYDHGGILYKTKRKPEYIALAPHDVDYVLPQNQKYPVYSFRFIYDSIRERKLLDVDSYELRRLNKKRLQYTREDEEKMIEYVKTTVGNPNNRIFWAGLADKGINHSDESLRYHWTRIMTGINKEEAERISSKNLKIKYEIIKPDEAETPKKSQSQFVLESLKSEQNFLSENENRTPSLAKCFENQFKRKRETSIEGMKKIREIDSCEKERSKKSQTKAIIKEIRVQNTKGIDHKESERSRQSQNKIPSNNLDLKARAYDELESISVTPISKKFSQTILCNSSNQEMQARGKSKIISQKSIEKENIHPNENIENPITEKKDFHFRPPLQSVVAEEEQLNNYVEINQSNSINKEILSDLESKTIEKPNIHLPASILRKNSPKIKEINQSCKIQKANEQYDFHDMFPKKEDFLVTFNNQTRTVHDLRPLRLLSNDYDIDNQFLKLVKLCQKISKKNLTEKEVISALESKDGVVADTVSYFLAQKIVM
ncbi:unnamed protein product [Blepharisma stoltei]|uniref:DNA-binding protein RAP1 n=1 Tax=Blepharisma stoltei TaxID=1481888 RepID=A0AAU9J383_9CILI|nr:unnamed protein product [Blepharisma stoltei]